MLFIIDIRVLGSGTVKENYNLCRKWTEVSGRLSYLKWWVTAQAQRDPPYPPTFFTTIHLPFPPLVVSFPDFGNDHVTLPLHHAFTAPVPYHALFTVPTFLVQPGSQPAFTPTPSARMHSPCCDIKTSLPSMCFPPMLPSINITAIKAHPPILPQPHPRRTHTHSPPLPAHGPLHIPHLRLQRIEVRKGSLLTFSQLIYRTTNQSLRSRGVGLVGRGVIRGRVALSCYWKRLWTRVPI